jgi:predicted SprT family Zn-dependent metalloprotease
MIKQMIELMRKCGYEGNRFSELQRPKELRRLSETFKAKCGCKVIEITKNRVTKMRNGSQYKCLSCNQRIVLVQ